MSSEHQFGDCPANPGQNFKHPAIVATTHIGPPKRDADGLVALTDATARTNNVTYIGVTESAADRKQCPITRGVLDYFPDAIAEVARLSKVGNDQHNPGQPMHWDRSKSSDHADCIVRHLLQRGTRDTDGMLHSAKVAWRALAMLQLEIESLRKETT